VLLLLDCCHASLAIRGARDLNLEVLVSCAMNLTTAGVGSRSFTSALTSELKRVARANRCISVLALHEWLSTDLAKLEESPFHYGLSKTRGESIVLRPLPQLVAAEKTIENPVKSVASVTFKVQFLENPEVVELVKWLKAAAPPTIAS